MARSPTAELDDRALARIAEAVNLAVNDKFQSYKKLAKFGVACAAVGITPLLSLVGFLFFSDSIRRNIINDYVLDFDTEIDRHIQYNKTTILETLLSDNEASQIGRHIEEYLTGVVAYSFSSEFSLFTHDGPASHTMPFYKTELDTAHLTCEATFPNNPSSNLVFFYFNDNPQNPPKYLLQLLPATASPVVTREWFFEKENNKLFGENSLPKPFQTVTFNLQEEPKITKPVVVKCTLLVIGPAKYKRK